MPSPLADTEPARLSFNRLLGELPAAVLVEGGP